jgi:hypothetical protein
MNFISWRSSIHKERPDHFRTLNCKVNWVFSTVNLSTFKGERDFASVSDRLSCTA